jgi:acyl carrier protein
MTRVTETQVHQFLIDRYSAVLSSAGVLATAISDDYDLLEEGVIDSLGLLEMISAVEKAFGIKLDFEGLEAESLTQIGPFCRYVAAQTRDDAGAAVSATLDK